MNHYTLPELLSGAKNGKVALDDEYYRRDDLIAAGCLVPVPDGKPCRPHDCGMFIVDGKVFDAYGVSAVDGTMPKCPDSVQPVRLVPLAELEAEHG